MATDKEKIDLVENVLKAFDLFEQTRWTWQSRKPVPLSSLLKPEDPLAPLKHVRAAMERSKEARKMVKKLADRYGKRSARDLRVWLGLKRGRPRDSLKWHAWELGAARREKDPKKYSWHTLARALDPKGYAQDARGAADRMRHGIQTVRKQSRDTGKSA